MKDYIIKKLHNAYLVFGTSAESPIYHIEGIEKEMCLKDGDAIILDQLLQVGDTEKRFFRLLVSNNRLNRDSIQFIDPDLIDGEIKQEVFKFLKEHPEILECSILPAYQKQSIADHESLL